MNNTKTYKIVVVTTVGCVGCNIAVENVKTAIKQSSKPIELVVKTRVEVGSRFIRKHNITDFPTILFYVDGDCKYKVTGSKHSVMILRWIDLHFK